ncbi:MULTISPECIES: Dabb family protein [unclassified Spirosoma]|uniref:Dabb family protein n=1 Tax=unclassified Spirosoma TaxID=2621999 RepID=UPI00095AD1B9|nr:MULTISPECIES: Dabb family protein [unclassified Spirosoma]MBN8826363.1 Dabb family protein [Spirosoma sp.]OJW76169.1 MAG: stress protein [Spirosoma sp. 48-14]
MSHQSRRNFVKNSVAAGLGASLPAVAPEAGQLFVHHVLFYLKNTGSEADKAKLLEGLNKLAKCPTIKLVHIGTPAATNRDVIERKYTYSWLCFFDSPADEEAYQKHPIHDDFRNNYAHLWEKVVIYDSIGPKR